MESENRMKALIRSSMEMRTTEELSEIWQKNDHIEWSNDAFKVVQELLLERLGTLPSQNSPIEEVVKIQNPAEYLLDDYDNKKHWESFLDLAWAICSTLAVIFTLYLVVLIISIVFPQSISADDSVPWYYIVCTLLTAPIYILRKLVKSDLQSVRNALLSILSKELTNK